jgi:osmotically inducible protein OsmC
MSETTASVRWEGRGKHGAGFVSTESPALHEFPYGFESRFGSAVDGTNPEELLGAAHAACFTMAISFACDKEGFATEWIHTEAKVTLDKDALGYVIGAIHLTLRASVPEISVADFQRIAETTKKTCPISRALAVPNVTLDARLE